MDRFLFPNLVQMHPLGVIAGVSIFLAVAPLSEFANAQTAPDENPVTLSLDVDRYFTDNVYFSRPSFGGERLSDWVTVIRPRFGYEYDFENGRINFDASAALGRYDTYSSEDYDDFMLSTDGLYRFDPNTFGVWGLSYGRQHEARNSIEPSDLVGSSPTIYWVTSAFGAVAHRAGDDIFKLGGTWDKYNYEDTPTSLIPGDINNDDRDRDHYTAGGKWTRSVGETDSVYVEGTLDWREYNEEPDDFGYDRDSHGIRAVVGWQTDLGLNGSGELYGGVLQQTYQDSRFDEVLAPDFGGRYSWQADGLSINAELNRTLQETTILGASSYLRTAATLSGSQDLPGNTRVFGGMSVAQLDFQSIDREDEVTNYWLGIRKYLSPYFYVGADANFEESESNQPINDYTETRMMLRAGLDNGNNFDPESVLDYGNVRPDFYVGAGVESTFIGTMLDGPRQNARGSLTTDFGDIGHGIFGLVGAGFDIGTTYLGLEVDAGRSDARWDHARLPGGRVFSVETGDTVGLSFLAGKRLTGGSLVYGRAGVRATEFETDYSTRNNSASYDNHETGFEYGFGVRAPVSNSFAVSMEYSQARYPDYAAFPGQNIPDRFANIEDRLRAALTYHFGGIPGTESEEKIIPVYDGAYWGIQGGWGTVVSDTQGNRQPEGTPPVTSVLNAEFADHGLAIGGLAGYNFELGNFVFGGELDAEYGLEEWNLERLPSGRTFLLDKKASIGASARLGFVAESGALFYGRVGLVSSLFENEFSGNNAELNNVNLDEKDWLDGVRYGAGIEVPVTEVSNLRFDYTVTDYGTLKLKTPTGTETYDTSENLFRAALIRKF